MSEHHTEQKGRRLGRWRKIAWSAAGIVLLIPLVAMQFTNEVQWTLSDFVIFGAMMGAAGLTLELAARKKGNKTYMYGAGVAVLGAFLMVWINGAVGIIGNEDNEANLIFAGVLAIALGGAVLARFKPAGMARAMTVTAGAQVLVFFIALIVGWGFTGPITLIFTTLWLVSARFFRQAAASSILESDGAAGFRQ